MLGLKCICCDGTEFIIKKQNLKYGEVKFKIPLTICKICGKDYATDEQMDEALIQFREAKEKCQKYEGRIKTSGLAMVAAPTGRAFRLPGV